MYKRIVVPLDGSALAEEALPFAERLVHSPDQEIYLLRIVEPRRVVVDNSSIPIAYPGGVIYTGLDMTAEELEAQTAMAEEYVKALAERMVSKGVRALPRVLPGKPAETIVKYVHDTNVDIVVISTRGNSGIKRMVLGSVCDEVIRTADAPVLVITPREVQEDRQRGHSVG